MVIAQFYRVFSPSCPVSSNNGRRRRDCRFTFYAFWIQYQAQKKDGKDLLGIKRYVFLNYWQSRVMDALLCPLKDRIRKKVKN